MRRILAIAAIGGCLALACEDPLTLPPAPPPPIDTPASLIGALSRAYQNHDAPLFASLLAHDTPANYVFLLGAPTDLGETQWDYAEEVRIHRRMFDPQHPPEGDPPVASELWLNSVSITLTPKQSFAQRYDLYTTRGGPLDPEIWRAMGASYTTYVFFDLSGTDYKVEGEAYFVVIEDLRKNVGDGGKFLLYLWDDVQTPWASTASSSASTWGSIKSLFR